MSYARYNITLTVVEPEERDKFRALNRSDTYREIRPNRDPGQRGAYSVELSPEEYEQALRDAANPDVNLIAVEPNPPPKPWPAVPGSTALTYVAANETTVDGSGVVVGQVDSGIDQDVADTYFAGRIKAADSFSGGDVYVDENGHGTRQVGISVPPGAHLAMAQGGDADEQATDSQAAEATYWLVDDVGIDVLLYEIASDGSTVLSDAVAHALSQNVIVVAPNGNGGAFNDGRPGENILQYPAGYSGVLAISNYSTDTDAIQTSSNYGSHTFAAAPGDVVNHYEAGGGEATFSGDTGGTSAASAMATGVVARMLSNGNSPGNVKSYLASTARKTGASPIYEGNGVLQLSAATNELQNDTPQKAELDGTPYPNNPDGSTPLDGVGASGSGGTGACGDMGPCP